MSQTFYLESSNKWCTTNVCSDTSSLQCVYQRASINDREQSHWICRQHQNISHYSQGPTVNIVEDRLVIGTQTSWRNEATEIRWKSARVSVKSCSWVGRARGNRTVWQRRALLNRACVLWQTAGWAWQQRARERKKAKSILSCINKIVVSRFKGKDFCPCLNTSVTIAGIVHQDLGFMTGKMSFSLKQVQWRVTKMVGGWSTYPVRERKLRKLSFFNLEKRGQLTGKLSQVIIL